LFAIGILITSSAGTMKRPQTKTWLDSY